MILNNEKIKRFLKYILMFFITTILVRYIPTIMISDENIIIISCLVSISYSILDRLSPSIK